MTGILLPSSDNLDSNNETELTPLAHGAFLSLFIRVKGPGFSSTSPLNAIDLYHTAPSRVPWEQKALLLPIQPCTGWEVGREKPFVTALHDKVLLCEELPIVFVHKSTLISFKPCSSVINTGNWLFMFSGSCLYKKQTRFLLFWAAIIYRLIIFFYWGSTSAF